MIAKHKDMYIYLCKTVETKLQLLEEAKLTNDPNIILTIIIFLNSSLNENLFGIIVMNDKICVPIYLQYLLATDYENFETCCLKYGKLKEYAKEKAKQIVLMRNDIERDKALKMCMEFCEKHPEELNQLYLLLTQLKSNKSNKK